MTKQRVAFACFISCAICLWACSRTATEQIPKIAPADIRSYVLPYCNNVQNLPIIGVHEPKAITMHALDFQFIFTPIGQLLHESVKPALEVSSCPVPQTVEINFGKGAAKHFILEPPDEGFLQHPIAVQVSHDLSENFDAQVCLKAGATIQHSLFLDGNALIRVNEGSHCFLLPNADLLDPGSVQGDLSGFFEQRQSVLTATVPGLGGTLLPQRLAVITACKNTFDSMEAFTCEDRIIDEFGRNCMQEMQRAPLGEIIHWSSCNLLHRIAASQCRRLQGTGQTPQQIAAQLTPLLAQECDKLPLLFSGLFL